MSYDLIIISAAEQLDCLIQRMSAAGLTAAEIVGIITAKAESLCER